MLIGELMKILFAVVWTGLLRSITCVSLNVTDATYLPTNNTKIPQINSTLTNSMQSVESVCGNGTLRNGEDYLIHLLNGSGCQHALPYFIRCSDYSYRMFESQ